MEQIRLQTAANEDISRKLDSAKEQNCNKVMDGYYLCMTFILIVFAVGMIHV